MSLSRRRLLAGAGGAGLAALGGGFCPNPAAAQDAKFFRIASGPTESSLFQAGTLIGQVVSSPPGARDCARGGSCGVPGMIAVNQTTAGSLANLELLTTGKIDSVLCQSDLAYAAFTGKGAWRGKTATANLRVLAYLYPETLHVIVRKSANVTELRGLRGKQVSLGERESGTANNARSLLAAAGVPERDLRAQYLKTAEAIDAMKAGKLDAFFETAVVPSSLVRELAADQDITLLPLGGLVARLRQELPFLTETTIPADSYPDTAETKAVSVGILWVVNESLDSAIAQGLVRALWHPNNRRTIDANERLGRLIRPESAADGFGLPLHAGALAYYQNAGLTR